MPALLAARPPLLPRFAEGDEDDDDDEVLPMARRDLVASEIGRAVRLARGGDGGGGGGGDGESAFSACRSDLRGLVGDAALASRLKLV